MLAREGQYWCIAQLAKMNIGPKIGELIADVKMVL